MKRSTMVISQDIDPGPSFEIISQPISTTVTAFRMMYFFQLEKTCISHVVHCDVITTFTVDPNIQQKKNDILVYLSS